MKLLNTDSPKSKPSISGEASVNWLQYWNQDRMWFQSSVWEINAQLLMQRVVPFLALSKNDRVLDIGCGAGHAAKILAPLCGSFLGADPSREFIKQAQARCSSLHNCEFYFLPDKNPNFQIWGEFSLFICASVIQYFSDIEQVLQMVESAQRAALPGARMLIADIPQSENFGRRLSHQLESVLRSIRGGYSLAYLKTFWDLIFSDYRRFSKNEPVLEIPVMELKRRISEMGFETILLEKSVSVCSGRPSLLIQF